MSATVTCRVEINRGRAGAVADADGRMSIAATNARGSFGAAPKSNAWRSVIQQVDGAVALRHDALDQLADRLERRGISGALAAIFSKTRRSPAAIASARLRSVISVMLARISRRLELGRRTKRTSHGKFWPAASQCAHSNTGASPASAPSMKPRGRPKDGVPSGWCAGTDLVRTAGEQGLAVHLEEAAGVVVDVDELAVDRRRTRRSLRERAPPACGSAPRFRASIARRDAVR